MTATPTMGGTLAVSVGGVNYAADPGPSQESYDRKYTALELANASRFNAVDYIEGDSELKWNLSKTLEDTDNALLTICGLGATVGLPTDTTVIYRLPEYTRTILHCMVNDAEITFEHGKDTKLVINGLATQSPADTSGYGGSPPTVTSGNFFRFGDLLTLFSKAAAAAPAQKFSVKLDHQLYSFYGVRSDGLALPTVLVPTYPMVSGSLDKLMVDDADYILYLATCQAKADMGLTAKSFCDSGGSTLTLTVKNALYTKPSRSGSVKEAVIETFPYMAVNVGGANPLVYSLVAPG